MCFLFYFLSFLCLGDVCHSAYSSDLEQVCNSEILLSLSAYLSAGDMSRLSRVSVGIHQQILLFWHHLSDAALLMSKLKEVKAKGFPYLVDSNYKSDVYKSINGTGTSWIKKDFFSYKNMILPDFCFLKAEVKIYLVVLELASHETEIDWSLICKDVRYPDMLYFIFSVRFSEQQNEFFNNIFATMSKTICNAVVGLEITEAGLRHIPENISLCSKLAFLRLDRNKLKEISSTFFTKLSFLRMLSLSHNQIQMLQLPKRSKIQSMNLSNNNLSEFSFYGLEKISELNLARNQQLTHINFDGITPTYLTNLKIPLQKNLEYRAKFLDLCYSIKPDEKNNVIVIDR